MTVQWLSEDVDVTDTGLFATSSESLWFVTLAGALDAGRHYHFSIVATSSTTGTIAADNITVFTNTPPADGSLVVWPSEGVALSTIFTLSSTSWQDVDDDARVLMHTFSHINTAGSRIGLGEATIGRNATARSILPAGNLTLCVAVTDPLGGASTATFDVTVTQSANVVAAVEHMTDEVSTLIASGDAEAALGFIAAGAESLPSEDSTASTQSYDSALTGLRSTLLSLAWNASDTVGESANTVALRAAALELIVSEPSQVRGTIYIHVVHRQRHD